MIDTSFPGGNFDPRSAKVRHGTISSVAEGERLCGTLDDKAFECYYSLLWKEYLDANPHLWRILCRAEAIIGDGETVRTLVWLREAHVHVTCIDAGLI